jgi:hypothetical protein
VEGDGVRVWGIGSDNVCERARYRVKGRDRKRENVSECVREREKEREREMNRVSQLVKKSK